MTFHRIDLLPSIDRGRSKELRKRWNTEEGRAIQIKIIKMIEEGAGEDFLQWDFESGNLGFLEDQWDLAGITLSGLSISFPDEDNFENIDFSHADFWHSRFVNAVFFQAHFRFAKMYKVDFEDCIFSFSFFYGCRFENCTFKNCDFVEANGFVNCEIKGCVYENCFFEENKFSSCSFDESVSFLNNKEPRKFGLISKASRFSSELKPSKISEIYRGLKDGYLAGEIAARAREYFFKQRQSYTRFNAVGLLQKSKLYFWEYVTGYGVRPGRVLISATVIWLLSLGWFSWRLGQPYEALILSAGSFLTFGAKAEILDRLSLVDHVIYISAAFLGIFSLALFITVVANVSFKDK